MYYSSIWLEETRKTTKRKSGQMAYRPRMKSGISRIIRKMFPTVWRYVPKFSNLFIFSQFVGDN